MLAMTVTMALSMAALTLPLSHPPLIHHPQAEVWTGKGRRLAEVGEEAVVVK